jgi:hypothetical protein
MPVPPPPPARLLLVVQVLLLLLQDHATAKLMGDGTAEMWPVAAPVNMVKNGNFEDTDGGDG